MDVCEVSKDTVHRCGGIDNPKVCTGCGQARYCSKACQKSAWPAHKADCKRFAAEKKKPAI
jgi:hypothetical protein